ncbi:hypothetical protein KJ586_04240 [Patescibacteria group bacterium]|nr:hypothetical protein [Patescibacteria group bacterium]MBU4347095.1 hypothetical protein [Patescibacteria group bacterium]MBU4455690.1 hypothetical protein [Patescibacteria group bacterium]MCG2691028.1 hypothetical protein [Candidatus Parcubacteria bacterium]
MTKARLHRVLEELNLKYTIDGEGGNFKIIIDLPEEHITEKNELMRGAVLNDDYATKFDKESIRPLIRKINGSTNFDCGIKTVNNQYIISVFKKF